MAAEQAPASARVRCGDPGDSGDSEPRPQGADNPAQHASNDLGPNYRGADDVGPDVVDHNVPGTAQLAAGTALLTGAIFDNDDDAGAVEAALIKLFGEEICSTDSLAFWTWQNVAVKERRTAFLAAGCTEAIVMPTGIHFHAGSIRRSRGERADTSILTSAQWRGVGHQGYLSRKEAARIAGPSLRRCAPSFRADPGIAARLVAARASPDRPCGVSRQSLGG